LASPILKDVRTLSGAVEHRKLSDELRQAIIDRLGHHEREFEKLQIASLVKQ
jgi:hypothetical protein